MKVCPISLLFALFGLVELNCLEPLTAADQPNVVFLFADDMRADSVGALGNPTVKTPTLDSLVKRGFSFQNAYCLGGNSPAVCTPSRNMLLSGNAYFRWKDFLPKGVKNEERRGNISPGDGPNWPISFREAGYVTYHYGKLGNTAPLIQAQFDLDKHLLNEQVERRSGQPGLTISDDAIEFIKAQDGSKPFFMYLAYGNPHDPRVVDAEYLDLYREDEIPLPSNFLPQHPFDNGEMVIRDELLLPWPRTAEGIRHQLHEYYATITCLDHHMGRVLQALKDYHFDENTIVIFSADQGVAIGSHGLLGKQNLYDAAMKVPLIFAGPSIPHGSSTALLYLLDLYPTLCDMVGAPIPSGIDGRSFRDSFSGNPARSELFFSYMDCQRGIRDQRYKLLRYPKVKVTQLFDLQSDPAEMKNLVDDPEQKERVESMMKRLETLQREFGDDLPLTAAETDSPEWTPPTGDDLDALLTRWKMK